MSRKPGGMKTSKYYSPSEAAAYLRRLADELDSGSISLGAEDLEFEREIKVKESLKSKGHGDKVKFQLKVSLHPHSGEQEPAPAAKPAPRAKKAAPTKKAAPKKVDSTKKPAPAKKAPAGKAQAKKAAAPKKATPAKPAPAGKKAAEPASYKDLKKRLSAGFKALRASLRDGQTPDPDTARAFCDDCLLIITFPGKGDPAYEGFKSQVEALSVALADGDPATVKQAFEEISAAKNRCHKQYK